MLKDRSTQRVYLVILFSLYLKEDVDEKGEISQRAREEANRPFEKRGEEERGRHGGVGEGGDRDEDRDEKAEGSGETVEPTNNDDDVD